MRRYAALFCLVCFPLLAGCDEVIGIARVLINAQLDSSGYDFTSDDGYDDNGFTPIVIQNNTLDLAAPTSTGLPGSLGSPSGTGIGGSFGGPGGTSLVVTTTGTAAQPTSGFTYISDDFFISIHVP
jgi:hypothetical protein